MRPLLRKDQLFHDGGRYHIETSPLILQSKSYRNQSIDFAEQINGLVSI